MSSNHSGGWVGLSKCTRHGTSLPSNCEGIACHGGPSQGKSIKWVSFVGPISKPQQLKTICLRDPSPLTRDCKGSKLVNDLLLFLRWWLLAFSYFMTRCYFFFILPDWAAAERTYPPVLQQGVTLVLFSQQEIQYLQFCKVKRLLKYCHCIAAFDSSIFYLISDVYNIFEIRYSIAKD